MTTWVQREYTDIAELRGPLLVVHGDGEPDVYVGLAGAGASAFTLRSRRSPILSRFKRSEIWRCLL